MLNMDVFTYSSCLALMARPMCRAGCQDLQSRGRYDGSRVGCFLRMFHFACGVSGKLRRCLECSWSVLQAAPPHSEPRTHVVETVVTVQSWQIRPECDMHGLRIGVQPGIGRCGSVAQLTAAVGDSTVRPAAEVVDQW